MLTGPQIAVAIVGAVLFLVVPTAFALRHAYRRGGAIGICIVIVLFVFFLFAGAFLIPSASDSFSMPETIQAIFSLWAVLLYGGAIVWGSGRLFAWFLRVLHNRVCANRID